MPFERRGDAGRGGGGEIGRLQAVESNAPDDDDDDDDDAHATPQPPLVVDGRTARGVRGLEDAIAPATTSVRTARATAPPRRLVLASSSLARATRLVSRALAPANA